LTGPPVQASNSIRSLGIIIATDSYGIYFGDTFIYKINYCSLPLIYLIPKIQSAIGSLVSNTLVWTPITGTFVANELEEYIVLGNFKSSSSTNILLINLTFSPSIYTDIYEPNSA
jgi:hypothetical protein